MTCQITTPSFVYIMNIYNIYFTIFFFFMGENLELIVLHRKQKKMSSKKIISLQKKVREKINSIHEQKSILTAMVDSFVSEVSDESLFFL